MKNNKGITMTSLIVTIIVMVILAGIALLFSVGDSGVISRAEKTQFLEDMKLYKEELELYKGQKQIENQKENKDLDDGISNLTKWRHQEIIENKYIPSMKREYDGKIIIWNGKLAYIKANLTAKEEELALAAGLITFDETVNVIVEIEGQGTVKVDGGELPENRIINADIRTDINLNAEPGKRIIGDKEIEYVFAGWYKDGELLSSDTNYDYEVMGEAEITAKFTSNATIIYFDDGSVELNTNDTISGYSNREDIVRVEIRDGVTIGISSFSGCTNLKEVIVGDNVIFNMDGQNHSWGYGSFENCTSLTKVTMGENIKIISNTTDLWIPDRKPILSGCTALEEVTIKSLSEVCSGACYGMKGALKGTITINEGVDKINYSAFNGCTNLEGVILPNSSLLTIGANAFLNCTSLNISKIPESVTTIGGSAFNGCTNLKIDINIKEGMILGSTAFNNSGITNLIIGNGINIPVSSFSGCTNLKEVLVGNNVTFNMDGQNHPWGYGAFENCTSLTKVAMGENIKIISNTTDLWIPDRKPILSGCTALEEVTIKSLSEVCSGACYGIKGALKGTITINEGVDKINYSAFNGCTNLEGVILPNSSLLTIGANAFFNCTSLNISKIPESVTTIGGNAFNGCTNLNIDVNIPTDMSIGATAFNNSGIKNLVIGNGRTISGREFENCIELETVTIGDNVIINPGGQYYWETHKGTFANCSKLHTVKIGNNIKMPNTTAYYFWFNNCPALSNVTVGSLSEIGLGAFKNVGKALKGTVTINSDVTTIGANAFNNCTGLTTINVDMTEEEFNTITKGSNWNYNVKATMNFLK